MHLGLHLAPFGSFWHIAFHSSFGFFLRTSQHGDGILNTTLANACLQCPQGATPDKVFNRLENYISGLGGHAHPKALLINEDRPHAVVLAKMQRGAWCIIDGNKPMRADGVAQKSKQVICTEFSGYHLHTLQHGHGDAATSILHYTSLPTSVQEQAEAGYAQVGD